MITSSIINHNHKQHNRKYLWTQTKMKMESEKNIYIRIHVWISIKYVIICEGLSFMDNFSHKHVEKKIIYGWKLSFFLWKKFHFQSVVWCLKFVAAVVDIFEIRMVAVRVLLITILTVFVSLYNNTDAKPTPMPQFPFTVTTKRNPVPWRQRNDGKCCEFGFLDWRLMSIMILCLIYWDF